jgi:hypothetical protein
MHRCGADSSPATGGSRYASAAFLLSPLLEPASPELEPEPPSEEEDDDESPEPPSLDADFDFRP